MTTCELCGKPAAPVFVSVVEVPPLPDVPHGYRREYELCERCYLEYVEGLAYVDREVRS